MERKYSLSLADIYNDHYQSVGDGTYDSLLELLLAVIHYQDQLHDEQSFVITLE